MNKPIEEFATPNQVWYWICTRFMRFILIPALGGFTIKYRERVPLTGPVIIAPNHLSHLDPPAVGSAVPRLVRSMSRANLFKNKAFAWLLYSIGVFPIERGTGDRKAIQFSLNTLRDGGCLMIFPEGTRGDGKTLGELQPGIFQFAKKSGAFIVPVGISGSEKVLAKGSSKVHRHRTTILFGEPMTYEDFAHGATEQEKMTSFVAEFERRLVAIAKEAGLKELKTSRNTESQTPASAPVQQIETQAHERA